MTVEVGAGLGDARVGTTLVFGVSGIVQASWVTRLPSLWGSLETGYAGLGLALFALGLGTLVAMALGSRFYRLSGSLDGVLHRWAGPLSAPLHRWAGPGRIVIAASAVAGVALVAMPLVGSLAQFAAVLFVFGLAAGAWDVAMNVEGSAVEQRGRKTSMNRLHGWWSVGTVIGALFGVLMAQLDVPTVWHFAIVAVVGFLLCLQGADAFDAAEGVPDRGERIGRRTVVVLGALILLGATIEGAASDWLAVYLRSDRHLTYAESAFGYAVFVGAMAAGRFAAHRLEPRIGLAGAMQAGVAVAATGALVAVLIPATAAAYAGALLWGLGSSVVFPAALSVTGRASQSKALVARMTLVGYTAGIGGPLVIGFLAHAVDFASALATVLPTLALAVIALAATVRRTVTDPIPD
jgi:MFS family permease